jgi:ABC-type nitrate/sulfonate/bicarbonate transport system permease component
MEEQEIPDNADVSEDSTTEAVESAISEAMPSEPRFRLFGLREEIPRWLAVAAGLSAVAICTGLWYFATIGPGEERILGHSQLPSIPETLEKLPSVWDAEAPERHLWDNTLKSLTRVVIGFALAVSIGVPVGIACGCFPLCRSFFSPLVLFGRNIPIAALIPLLLAMFQTGELQKYMFIFVACVAFIIADTIDAIADVAQRYVETALTLGASRLQIVFKVLVPLAMPTVFNSLRVMFGLAFGYIMLVEFMHEGEGAGGLGFLLNIARRRGITEYTVIIILTIPLVAWMIDQVLYVIQCWLFPWKYSEESKRSLAFRVSERVLRLFWKRKLSKV